MSDVAVAESPGAEAIVSQDTAAPVETFETSETVEDLLVEDVSIDGMCGVY